MGSLFPDGESPERPPLLIIANPDGSPDWPNLNALARQTILKILEAQKGPGLSGAELMRRCSEAGFHPKVTWFSLRALESEGAVVADKPRIRTRGGRCMARLWSLAA
jgi:hypothetical protein